MFVDFEPGEMESSEVIRKYYYRNWARIFGSPDELWVDQARNNLGPPVQNGCEKWSVELRE